MNVANYVLFFIHICTNGWNLIFKKTNYKNAVKLEKNNLACITIFCRKTSRIPYPRFLAPMYLGLYSKNGDEQKKKISQNIKKD